METLFLSSTHDAFKTVCSIRTAVFTEEQGADAQQEFDGYDLDGAGTVYVLLFENGEAAATARLAHTDSGFKIGRIAVLKKYRGKGIGEAAVRAVTEKAFSLGADTVYVDAQNHAVGFYEKFGFTVTGGRIYDRGLAHMPMRLDKNNYRQD